jgi:putative ABC transport system permease protein
MAGAKERSSPSASTPLVLTVALSSTFLFGFTTTEHATTQQQRAALTGQLAVTCAGPGLPATALADVRATPGVHSAVALTSTSLGPSLGSTNILPAQILTGGQGGGLDVGVIAGSLSALHGDAIALGRHRADDAHARVGNRVAIMLGDGTQSQATVVAIYTRDLAFGDALLAPELAAGHQTTPLLNEILIQTDKPAVVVAGKLHALAQRYPGLQVGDSASLVTANAASDQLRHPRPYWSRPMAADGCSMVARMPVRPSPTRSRTPSPCLRKRPLEEIIERIATSAPALAQHSQ